MSSFNLKNLRQRDIALIIIALTVLLGALWYFYMYRPTLERIEVLNGEIADLDVQIQRGELARANLPELREAVAQAEEERRAFLAELPRESEVAQLLNQLRVAAAGSGVVFESISQGGAQGEDVQGVRPLGFSVTTEGTYGETLNYLETLESLTRFTKLRQVSLTLEDDGAIDPSLRTTYTFTVYVFVGDDFGDDVGNDAGNVGSEASS